MDAWLLAAQVTWKWKLIFASCSQVREENPWAVRILWYQFILIYSSALRCQPWYAWVFASTFYRPTTLRLILLLGCWSQTFCQEYQIYCSLAKHSRLLLQAANHRNTEDFAFSFANNFVKLQMLFWMKKLFCFFLCLSVDLMFPLPTVLPLKSTVTSNESESGFGSLLDVVPPSFLYACQLFMQRL